MRTVSILDAFRCACLTQYLVWTLAGVVAIKGMGGPDIPWKPGRSDFENDSLLPPRGRLPDGAQAQDHLRHIFYRMGFNDQEIVALSGAHNLGRCHSDRSGFEGAWVNNPTRFSNQYFKLLLKLKWEKRDLGREGAPWQWSARTPGMDDDDEPLMMLPTDFSLTQDKEFKVWVEKVRKFATDHMHESDISLSTLKTKIYFSTTLVKYSLNSLSWVFTATKTALPASATSRKALINLHPKRVSMQAHPRKIHRKAHMWSSPACNGLRPRFLSLSH